MRYTVDTAITLLNEKIVTQNEYEVVNLLDSVDRVLAEDIVARFNVPSFEKSAMDGYAIFSEDTKGCNKYNPAKLKIIGKVYAGDDKHIDFKRGTAVRIMTGAKIPEGYDAVVRQEYTDLGEEEVLIYNPVRKGENYCQIGEDIKKDDIIIKKHKKIKPYHISVMASLGYDKLKVVKRLRASIISTGSEIVDLDHELGNNQTYNSTTYQIMAIFKRNAIECVNHRHCNDDVADIKASIEEFTKDSEVIITTGGISVGERDLLPKVLKDMGAEILFRGVDIKPGTPVTAAYYNNCLILCCSGNPFACLVNFHVFFWNIFARRMNCKDILPRKRIGTLVKGEMKAKKYVSYMRAYYENGEVFINDDGHRSSIMSSAMDSNCFAINDTDSTIEVGDNIKVHLIEN